MDTNLSYTSEHEWVRFDEDAKTATIGVTDYAAKQLGDVVYLDLPEAGSDIAAGETMGEIESTKSVSDLYAPISGSVIEVNDAVVSSPELVNSDPFDEGWLIKASYTDIPEDLMNADQYTEFIGA
ncbi:glycine cleavage system protein GcvH [Devriesea agamarum]|uniref:glycine cleavage system protein GcvH n=1 Tax=Devriesea agamarum TaxID=472569 RepID=UPI00071E67F5|nr:glycine cleavage system protein GcvH [Devriesea agamarum]